MKTITYIFLFTICLSSCTSFSSYSLKNKIETCTHEDLNHYVCVLNDSLKVKFVSFGGFKFANSLHQYKMLKIKNKPHFKDIIIFGRSEYINTDYYILLNNKKNHPDFNYRDTLIAGNKLSIAVTKNSNNTNKTFLLNGFKTAQNLED